MSASAPIKERSMKQRVASIPRLRWVFSAASGSANRRNKPVTLAKIKTVENKDVKRNA